MNKFTFIALVFGLAEAHKLNRFITDEQYAVEQAKIRRNMIEDDEMPDDHLVQFITDDQYAVQQEKKRFAKENEMTDF